MTKRRSRPSIEWQPGPGAIEALTEAQALKPHLGRQELIDFLVMTGLAAIVHQPWRPPELYGTERDAWRLPPHLVRKRKSPDQ